jgi:5'-methylthioadenosine phosphorylase
MSGTTPIAIGIIGGSGLYQMPDLQQIEEHTITTPFGSPSDTIISGTLNGIRVAFLPRHGRGHRINPTHLPARANIWALKSLGVERIISISAVGSLREDYAPLDLVIPDQLVDHTKSRVNSFFEDGLVVHVAFADPFCLELSNLVAQTAESFSGARVHRGGTYICIEGPLFSTRAESRIYRQWGMDIIGMTALPEAKLAREAEICYATIACVTDYDSWHESEADVSVDLVIANLTRNITAAQATIRQVVDAIPANRDCLCASALANSLITDRAIVTPAIREKYDLLVRKYL